jgi:hypothetical protein
VALSVGRLSSIEWRKTATRTVILEAAWQIFASVNKAEAKIGDIFRTA